MKYKTVTIVFVFIIFSSFILSQKFTIYFPEKFPPPQYDFKKNPLSKVKIELGRVLFYDPILSKDSSVSCASCHSPYNAFAHTDHALSHGINDQIGNRNAPALFNLAWNQSFMWDGAVNHIDVQPLAPITHPKEMGEDLTKMIQKLNKSKFYTSMFHKTYGTKKITTEMVLTSLAQFQLSLISANSKYDRVKSCKETFNEKEQKGYALFLKHCNSCHTEPLFTNHTFANNGLSLDTNIRDYGRWNITKQSVDSLTFKVPSLRNISFTYPYMHDGRFGKLSQVLNHYSNTIKPNNLLSQPLKGSLELSSDEKTEIIAFLLTLNDTSFIKNEKHQFPKYILNKAAMN